MIIGAAGGLLPAIRAARVPVTMALRAGSVGAVTSSNCAPYSTRTGYTPAQEEYATRAVVRRAPAAVEQ